jgi:hypothetical protein
LPIRQSARVVADSSDFNAAVFEPLEGELATRLARAFAEQFIESGGLDRTWTDDAADQVRFERGRTPSGRSVLRAHLPIGAGHPEYEWSGEATDAMEIVIEMAHTAGRTIHLERADPDCGPTGWEHPRSEQRP